VVALVGSISTAAQADTMLEGSTAGGAFFKIVVPDSWNGDLVIYNHGFDLSEIGPTPDLGPLASLQLSEGYAVAASSYRMIGWALFRTRQDNRKLYTTFKKEFGAPNATYVNGASLGGIVTAQALELANLGNEVGAYPFCGALAGSRNFDAGIDLRLIYDLVCEDVPGAAIPGGPTGLPDPGFPDYPFSDVDMALAVNECTGILAPPAFRSPEQAARLDRILAETTIPENFLLTDMGFAVFGLSELIFSPEKLKGKQGVGNAHVHYSDPEINHNVERVTAKKGSAKRLAKYFTPTGHLQDDTKIVSIHTDLDGLVIVENESEYQKVIDPDNLTVGIVVEDVPTHCSGFSQAELVAGWESLRGWVATDAQPSVAEIQGLCQGLEGAGLAAGPCRYDPAYVIGDFDDRVPPR
jgi:hypothetical protein